MEGTWFIRGPDFQQDLSILDVRLVGVYSRRIECFRVPTSVNKQRALDVLKQALQALVNNVPALGGVCTVDTPGPQKNWKSITVGPGIEYIVKDFSETLSFASLEARKFDPNDLSDAQLIPVGKAIVTEGSFPVCKVQANCIDGGILLSVCICHQLSDGNGMTVITKLLAEQCRIITETGHPGPKQIIHEDRRIVHTLKSDTKLNIEDHPAWALEPPPRDPTDAAASNPGAKVVSPAPPKTKLRLHYIPPSRLAALKEAAAAANRISTHDALSALLWVLTIRMRHMTGTIQSPDIVSHCYIPSDARRHTDLPASYLGNAVYHVRAKLPVSELLDHSGLQRAAAAIRSAINAVNVEVVAGMVTLSRSLPDATALAWGGVKNCQTSDCTILTMWKAGDGVAPGSDWGSVLGKVEYFRFGDDGAIPGFLMQTIMPRVKGKGAELLMCVEEGKGERTVMEDELFKSYFEHSGSLRI